MMSEPDYPDCPLPSGMKGKIVPTSNESSQLIRNHVEIIGTFNVPSIMRRIKINGVEIAAECISIDGVASSNDADEVRPLAITVRIIPESFTLTGEHSWTYGDD